MRVVWTAWALRDLASLRAYIWQNNPKNPLGVGASDQGGYFMSGVEDNNLDSEKLVNIWWTGAKYTYRSKTDVTFSWYQQRQNTFRVPPTCVPGNFRASCAGTLNEGSLYVDHLVKQALPGVPLSHLPSPPSAIPVKLNYQYFSLNQSGAAWEAVKRARNFAVHVPENFRNPNLELIILLPEAA